MSVIVKICGLSDEQTVDAAVAAGADMVGFVFFAASPRVVSIARAATLADRARGRTETVALIVDMDDAEISAIVERVHPEWLQLHGRETPDRVAFLRRRFPTRMMKAIGVRDRGDLAAAHTYSAVADRLMLDAKAPMRAERPGGRGIAFDWGLLAGFTPGLPYLLAGGLDAGNVAEALRAANAAGVDVSSGVEREPGIKDPAMIHEFVKAARRAESAASAEAQLS